MGHQHPSLPQGQGEGSSEARGRAQVPEGGRTHLSPDLLLDALLGLGQYGHRGHVRPSQGLCHLLQCHISKELLHMCEKYVENTIANLKKEKRICKKNIKFISFHLCLLPKYLL